MEHYCKNCKNSNGDNTCSLTGATHTTGIECPSFRQKEEEMKEGAKFRVRKTDDRNDTWTVADGDRCDTSSNYIRRSGIVGACVAYGTEGEAQEALDLYLAAQGLVMTEERVGPCPKIYNHKYGSPTEAGHIARVFVGHPDKTLNMKEKRVPAFKPSLGPTRTFESGATRDTDQGKLDYVKALSPIVLRRYVQYLDKHRKQSDGTYRSFDNWKAGIPQKVYLSSLSRHFIDVWLLAHGQETLDNHGPVDEESALCAVLFNAMGLLYEKLRAKTDRTAPTEEGY